MIDEPRPGSNLDAEPLANENLKFLENIELALLENSQTKRTKRTDIAKCFSWDVLFREYEEKIKF